MANIDESENALNPTVVKLGLVSLLADVSSEMLYPITPIFLTAVLGASMTSVGLIEGVAEGIASLLKTFSGAWSDRISRRKPFVAGGYFLSALAKPLTGLAGSWVDVLFARGLDRTGKGLRTAPRDALLADSISERVRGAAFGWHRGMDTLGAAIGPLLAILYLSYHADNLAPIYFWAVIPGMLAVVVALLVKEKPRSADAKAKPIVFSQFWTFSKEMKLYLASWTVFSLCNSSDVFLLMRAKAQGLSLTRVIVIYCFYNLVYAVGSPYLGKLSDELGRKKILLAGLLIFAGVYLGFSLATAQWEFWALFGIYGIYIAATDGVGKALAVDLIDPDKKATGLGVLGTVTGIATVFASTAAGFLWDHFGSQATFYFGAAGSLVAAMMLLALHENRELKNA